MKELQGKFVTLKLLNESHAEFIVNLRNSEVARFINKGAATVEQQIKWINSRGEKEYNYVIYFENEPVGQMSLYDISKEHNTAEAGRLILSNKIPKGFPITFEAILLIHTFAFFELNIRKISGVVAAGNSGAVKLNDFVKMKREGILRQQFIFEDTIQDGIIFGLLKDEFVKEQQPFLQKIINLIKN